MDPPNAQVAVFFKPIYNWRGGSSHNRLSCRAQGKARVKTRSLEIQTSPTAKKTSCLGKISKLFHSLQFPNAVFLALALLKQKDSLKSTYY